MSEGSGRRLKFTDLVVVLLLLVPVGGALLAYVFVPAPRVANRVLCATNLRQVGQGMAMYAGANNGAFPRALFDGQGGVPTEYSRWQSPNPFQPGGPGPNDVTAALFLLLRTQDLTPDVFVCPSVEPSEPWDYGGRGATKVSNFPGRRYLGYSYVNPYASPAAVAAGFKLNYTLSSDFAVAADMNPGGQAVVDALVGWPRQKMVQANSRNHNGDGQNVLYGDGHVEFQNTPFCGEVRNRDQPAKLFRDNIYTYGAARGPDSPYGVRGSPTDAFDSVLLPTAQDGPAPAAGATPRTLLLRAIAAAFGLGTLLVILLRVRRKPPATPPST